jgi:hypothetical protein
LCRRLIYPSAWKGDSAKSAYQILDARIPRLPRTTSPHCEKHTNRHHILCARINMPPCAHRTPPSAARFLAPVTNGRCPAS